MLHRRHVLRIDVRALALFRIAMGCVLLADLASRIRWLTLPNALLAAIGVAYALFTVGWRTRATHVVSLAGLIALNASNLFIASGGHREMAWILLWTCFLPLGERFSIDARRTKEPSEGHAASIATVVIAAQIAAIYLLVALQKGPTWWDGTALERVLWQPCMGRAWTPWLRDALPPFASTVLSPLLVLAEIAAGLAALATPWSQRARKLYIFAVLAIHAAVLLLVDVWPHSHAMLAIALLLLPRDWLDRLSPPREGVISSGRMGEALVAIFAAAALVLLVTGASWADRLRLSQRWMMFAHLQPRIAWITIDAERSDGTHHDPLTSAAPSYEPRPSQPAEVCAFHRQLMTSQAARDHLQRRLATTHDIVRYQVWLLHDELPPKGARRVLLLEGP